MKEKLYSLNEASRIFNIPRSVLVNGVINEAIETTLKYDTIGNRCRHKHYVTEKVAMEFYQEYLAAEETRVIRDEEAAKRKYSKVTDTYNQVARHKLEDLLLLKELAGYGVCATTDDLM
jgi:hypothetical protein